MSATLSVRQALERFWLALAGAALLVTAEFFAVAFLVRRDLASVWEVELGGLWLAPSALVLVVMGAVVGAVLHAVTRRCAGIVGVERRAGEQGSHAFEVAGIAQFGDGEQDVIDRHP